MELHMAFDNPEKPILLLGKIVDILRLRTTVLVFQANAIVAIVYLLLLPTPIQYLDEFIFFLVFQFFLISFGYVANSYSDAGIDRMAGKYNSAIEAFPHIANFLIGVLYISAIAVSSLFNSFSFLIGAVSVLLATSYSLKPIRLKEHGFAGIMASSLSQSFLPFLFFVSITMQNHFTLYLATWLLLRNIYLELSHQLGDYDADKASGTKTFAVLFGRDKISAAMRLLPVFFVIFTFMPLALLNFEGLTVSTILFLFSLHYLAHIFKI